MKAIITLYLPHKLFSSSHILVILSHTLLQLISIISFISCHQYGGFPSVLIMSFTAPKRTATAVLLLPEEIEIGGFYPFTIDNYVGRA